MKYYIGLDVSKQETAVCVMSQKQEIFAEFFVETDPYAIGFYINSLGDIDIELIGLESGSWSHWLTSELRELGLPAICMDARKVSSVLSIKVNKNDRNDARGIADCLRCGYYTEVYTKTSNSLALSSILRSRRKLVDQRVEVQHMIRGLLKTFGIKLKICQGKSFQETVIQEMKIIPELAQKGIEALLACHQQLCEHAKELEKHLKQEVANNPTVQKIMTVTGVGMITSLTFVAEIGDPKRFEESRDVGAYIGMTPKQYSSGETERMGRISKQGASDLRSLLTEAGFVVLTRTKGWSKLKAWGLKIMKKHGPKKAAVAVGRKMAVIMHRMMITGEEFKYGEVKQAA